MSGLEWVVTLPVNRHLVMVFIALLCPLGGSFLDDLAFMIGVVIPPVAMNAFGVIYRGAVPFLAGLLTK